jgi:hypothetical protein
MIPKPQEPKAPKPIEPVAGVEVGDHVFVQHPRRGPISVKVLAHGKDGLQGDCEMGERHRVGWGDVLGHKSRQIQSYTVVDQGADGAIMQDETGRRRYLAGSGTGDNEPKQAAGSTPAAAPSKDDVLLDGLDKLAKSLKAWGEFGAPAFFIKAEGTGKPPVNSRPGLTLKPITDKRGVVTKRWVRVGQKEPVDKGSSPSEGASSPSEGAKPPSSGGGALPSKPHGVGDSVSFRSPDGAGKGQVIASGADGVTVKDEAGKEHQVRHEHVVNPGQAATPAENDKTATAPPASQPPPLFKPEQIDNLPKDAAQPVDNEEAIFKLGAEGLDQLTEWLDKGKGVAVAAGAQHMQVAPDDADLTKPGPMLFIANLKGRGRAKEKVDMPVDQDGYGGDWSKLLDVVRCSIACDTHQEVQSFLDKLLASGMKFARKPKDRFSNPLPVGYRDCLMNVTLPNGMVAEVQLHVKPMMIAKTEGHHYYEVQRSLEGKIMKEGGSPEETKAVADALSKQKQIYGDAWKQVTEAAGGAGAGAGNGEGEDMQKSMKGLAMAGYKFFEHEGNKYRRSAGSGLMSVSHVLVGNSWQPFKGKDALAPGMFGDEIDDPLGGSMRKAEAPRVLFLKANVSGYTKKDGTVVAPHTDNRPVGQWYLHKKHKDGTVEHHRVMAAAKPKFSGSGKKIERFYNNADGTVNYQSQHDYWRTAASHEEMQKRLPSEKFPKPGDP